MRYRAALLVFSLLAGSASAVQTAGGVDPGPTDDGPGVGDYNGGCPPNAGSGAGGTYAGPGDRTAGSRPAAPPGAPGASDSGGPSTPTPGAAAPTAGAVPESPSTPTPQGLAAALDLTTWDRWWEHNKDPYLALASALDRLHPQTPADDSRLDPLRARRAGLTWSAVYGEVLPALLAALEGTHDQRLVRGILIALARIGEAPPFEGAGPAPQLEPLIARHVADSNQSISETAAIALGVLGSRSGVAHLAELAADTKAGQELCARPRVPVRLRAFACYGMAVSASFEPSEEVTRFVIHHLARVLDEDGAEHPDLSAACVIGLGLVRLDPRRGPVLGKADADWPSSCFAAQVEHLLALLQDEDAPRFARAHAPTSLARVVSGGPEVVRGRAAAELVKRADPRIEDDFHVRRSAVLAMGILGDADEDEADEHLRVALEEAAASSDELMRSFAVIALGQVGARAGNGAGSPLAAGPSATAFLAQRLARGKSRTRPWVGLGLGLFGNGLAQSGQLMARAPADALLHEVESTRSPEYLAAYSLASGLYADTRAREAVEEHLSRVQDPSYRGHVAVSLGLMGDRAALPALRAVMAESLHKPRIQEQAAIARALLGDRDLIPELLERLDECDCWTSSWGVTRALAWTADHRALEPLLEFLADDGRTAGERGLAADALGWICDKERVVWDSRISFGLNYTAATETLTNPLGFGILDTL